MANNINRLGFNIAGYNYLRQEDTAANSKPEQKSQSAEKQTKQLPANDVLGYMSTMNADMIPVKAQRTVDINKYVTPEQADRISGFIKGFESDFNEAAQSAMNEFGIDAKLADKIALSYINASY